MSAYGQSARFLSLPSIDATALGSPGNWSAGAGRISPSRRLNMLTAKARDWGALSSGDFHVIW